VLTLRYDSCCKRFREVCGEYAGPQRSLRFAVSSLSGVAGNQDGTVYARRRGKIRFIRDSAPWLYTPLPFQNRLRRFDMAVPSQAGMFFIFIFSF